MKRRLFLLLTSALAVSAAPASVGGLTGCDDGLPPKTPRILPPKPAVDERAEIELVESVPAETTLDHADVRDAKEVWPEMIAGAKRTIDLSEFYASDIGGEKEHPPKRDQAKTSPLTGVIVALEQAAARGVKIRFLVDEGFAPKYPATVERLRQIGDSSADKGEKNEKAEKIAIRTIDAAKRYGGVQHAKYMIIDGADAFVGSQNFDWRSLTHIQEMGVRLHSPAIAGSLSDIFETDWALADAGTAADARNHEHAKTLPETRAQTGEAVALYASPKGWLPDESRWDLTRLVSLIDGAKRSLALQVLTYSTHNRDKTEFKELDDALRRAAGRGVQIRLLVSHWGANAGSAARRSVESLAAVPNVVARVLTIPPWSGGDIPFARVSHAKYMVVDDRAAWVGTSNWEGDYFYKSRNVAIVAEDGSLAPRLGRIFEDGWSSSYAKPLPGVAAPEPTKDSKDSSKDGEGAKDTTAK